MKTQFVTFALAGIAVVSAFAHSRGYDSAPAPADANVHPDVELAAAGYPIAQLSPASEEVLERARRATPEGVMCRTNSGEFKSLGSGTRHKYMSVLNGRTVIASRTPGGWGDDGRSGVTWAFFFLSADQTRVESVRQAKIAYETWDRGTITNPSKQSAWTRKYDAQCTIEAGAEWRDAQKKVWRELDDSKARRGGCSPGYGTCAYGADGGLAR